MEQNQNDFPQNRRDDRRAQHMASTRREQKNAQRDMNRGLNQYFFGEDDED